MATHPESINVNGHGNNPGSLADLSEKYRESYHKEHLIRLFNRHALLVASGLSAYMLTVGLESNNKSMVEWFLLPLAGAVVLREYQKDKLVQKDVEQNVYLEQVVDKFVSGSR